MISRENKFEKGKSFIKNICSPNSGKESNHKSINKFEISIFLFEILRIFIHFTRII